MGKYINVGNKGFSRYRNGEYVDKTEMIAYINSTLNTANMLTCMSRPRRFGKSVAAKMLYAYYDLSCDSHDIFDDLKIAKDNSYTQHLNKYPTIYIDITDFITKYKNKDDIVKKMQFEIIKDLKKAYPSIEVEEEDDLMDVLLNIVIDSGKQFIMIIDEWDALCREAAGNKKMMDDYVNLLRRLFKGGNTSTVFAGVYMTGILPIKKYGTQSALNDFREYSMTSSGILAEYFGFTSDEVQALCDKHDMDYNEMCHWYDGYHLNASVSVFNPNSVMMALLQRKCDNYWAKTESFESLQRYIDMNFTGVKESLEKILDGEGQKISVLRFGNDLNDVQTDDELFTLLAHLGYLSYDDISMKVTIPNQEIRIEFTEAVRGSKSHRELAQMVKDSDLLLEATWNMDSNAVAKAIDKIHNTQTAPNFYNNEQALRSVIRMAYLGSVDYYVEIQELPSGKGYADIAFFPRKSINKPALLVELKWNQTSDAAISQIKRKQYMGKVAEYTGDMLLVGINYDKQTKLHDCKIEQWRKD